MRLRAQEPAPAGTGGDLEQLAAYLVSLLPGYRLRRNALASDYACELDVIAALTPYARPLFSDQPSSMLIECKNWKKDRVGVSYVSHVFARMMILSCRIGVIISQHGVTNMRPQDDALAREERAGMAMIRRLFHETGRLVLSLDSGALERVESYGSFLQVLQEAYENFVFG